MQLPRIMMLMGALTVVAILVVCSKSTDPKHDPWPERMAAIDSARTIQESYLEELANLVQHLDSATAKDSLVQLLQQEPRVDSAWSAEHGFWIEFKDGILGGICLDPVSIKSSVSNQDSFKSHREPLTLEVVIPESKNAIYFAPAFTDLYPSDAEVIASITPDLATAGYGSLQVLKDAQCSVAEFADVTGYGVICLSSHGGPFPNVNNIQTYYLLTGEEANPATDSAFQTELGTSLATWFDRKTQKHWYLISPEFVKKYWRIAQDRPVVNLGFCYSFLGGWPTELRGMGALACIGYDWSVLDYKYVEWTIEFFDLMCDRTRETPMIMSEWYSSIQTYYWYEKDQRNVYIKYDAQSNTALWDEPQECEDFPPPPGERWTYEIVGEGYGFTTVSESVSESVGGYTVYRLRPTSNPPHLGQYYGCIDEHGEVEVATDWWNVTNPSDNGRFYYVPPLFGCQFGDPVGTSSIWTGSFGGGSAREESHVLAYETVSVPYGTFYNVMKVRIESYDGDGHETDEPLYFWFDENIGPIKAQEVRSGSTVVLVGYSPPGGVSKVAGSERTSGCSIMAFKKVLRSQLGQFER